MEEFNFYFTDHWGGFLPGTDVKLYESTWNDWGHHGIFEFVFQNEGKLKLSHTPESCNFVFRLGRLDGDRMKRLELNSLYGDRLIHELPNYSYISFPSKDLCVALLLNFSLEVRKKIAESLSFNFGEGINFTRFKYTDMYKKAILRNITESEFLNDLNERKKIYYSELPISEWLPKTK